MTEQLRVAFTSDMPAAAVEVISPALEVVDRFMLDAGGSRTTRVPSEASFLRVHLPSGQVVTLQDPGNPDREVSLADVLTGNRRFPGTTIRSAGGELPLSPADADLSERPTGGELRRYERMRSSTTPEVTDRGIQLPLGTTGATVILLDPDGNPLPGASSSRGREARWDNLTALPPSRDNPRRPPYHLRIQQRSGPVVQVTVPGNVCNIWTRADILRGHDATSITVRIHTTSEAADTIAGYLSRGDLYAAEAMTEWTDHAIDMLYSKVADPYAAAVGGYLLLRFHRHTQMHDWAQNLANWFPFLPDGCVIRACQLMQQPTTETGHVEDLLLQAVERGTPVYTEGLRLLTDALRLMGTKGQEALGTLRAATGTVMWDSPVTTSASTTPTAPRNPHEPTVVFDVAFAARV